MFQSRELDLLPEFFQAMCHPPWTTQWYPRCPTEAPGLHLASEGSAKLHPEYKLLLSSVCHNQRLNSALKQVDMTNILYHISAQSVANVMR